jgi:thiol-disulfide isomerase/thioredoxin
MIPEKEKNQIENWTRSVKEDVFIRLVLTDDERSRTFQDFCGQLALISPKIKIESEKDEDITFPVIRVGNVGYRAIPLDPELEPFLKALSGVNSDIPNLPFSVKDKLLQVQIPAYLKVYIMPHCPFCPTIVKQLLSLAAENESIRLTVIDGVLFPETAASDKIRAAPTVLLDDQFRWSGPIQIRDIVDMILSRDPTKISALSLKTMFEEGDAAKVAEMMLDSGKIFPAFLELLVHEKWPIRLAAMVAFETIAEINPPLVQSTIPFLWRSFSKAEDTIKGDILYLCGISGEKNIIPKLKTVLNGLYSVDVKEAAEDALETLRSAHP